MKKVSVKTVFLPLLLSLFFSGCENFLSGSQLVKDIDESISDANAERVNLSILAYSAQGTLTGEKGGIYKVCSDSNSLSFSENAG